MNYNPHGKRLVDLVVAAVLLVLLAPLMACVAAVVLASCGRPVLFKQRRPGLRGQPFVLLKFRTMREIRDETGALCPDAERLTAVGRWLRATSLDELPELANIVRGDMSLVGPRPLLEQYLDRYSPEQRRRHNVRPGLTGLAQVNGRNALDWRRRLALDVEYVDRLSPLLDLRILLHTVSAVLKREGIHQEGQATVEEFRGEQER